MDNFPLLRFAAESDTDGVAPAVPIQSTVTLFAPGDTGGLDLPERVDSSDSFTIPEG